MTFKDNSGNIYTTTKEGGVTCVGLKSTGKSISVLLSPEMYEKIKHDADEKCVGISSFIKVIISDYYKQKEN